MEPNAALRGAFAFVCLMASAAAASAAVAISPGSQTIKENATVQFKASVPSTWTASCGSIYSSGLYRAGLYPATCTITAQATSGGSTASVKVTVVSPVTMSPVSASTSKGGTQQFLASAPVIWSAGAACGTITAAGIFTATGSVGSYCTVDGTAASGTKYHVYGYDHIVQPAASLTVTPPTATLLEGATQQFSASASGTWTASCGTVTSAGLYTAPLVAETCTVKATPTAGGSAASAIVTVTSPIVITPSSTTTSQNATQQFTANMAAIWSASCGTISSTGLFAALGTQGAVCVIQATAASGTPYTGTASDIIGPPAVLFSILPTAASVSEGGTQQFTGNAGATWSATCGTVSSAGLYTAPLTAENCTVTGMPAAGGNGASAAVTVTSPISIIPSAVNLHALNTQVFTASQAVIWTASCGTVTSAGTFTAPASAGPCTLTATASNGTPYTAAATVNVDVVNYTAWKGGGGLTGAQTDELSLTPANVSSSSFGIVWTASVDGWVTAQPLYINGLMINGLAYNVVFVCTNNDSVYAFDGDTGAQLWQTSLIPIGGTAVAAAQVGYTSTQQQFGILGTPVIDPTTNTIYVVSETAEQRGTYFPHRLHALDVTSGNEKFGGPVVISNPQMAPTLKLQRTGLLLVGGVVYVGIGSLQDRTPYNGLLFGFNAATLAQQSVWVTTPTGSEGGVWMGGAAPSVDESGNIYVTTGNGTFDGVSNFGEAAVKLSSSLQVLDYFAPYNNGSLSAGDLDLGSGSVMVVPDQVGVYPHELILCGKPPPVYVLNRDNLGRVGTTSDNVIQEVNSQVGLSSAACLTAPAMWGQNVYFGGKSDVLKMFTLNASTGMLSTTPVSQGTLVYGYPGADPVVSANGSTNGIVWTVDTNTNSLRANDATNVANELYSGALAGGAFHWVVPTAVNGHVYVGGEKSVFAFGLKQ